MDLIEKLLSLSIGGITIGGIIVYLGKKIIDKSSEIIIEDYKNKLEILKVEHQIKFSKLYEERGEVIKTVYQSLYELERKLEKLTSPFQGSEWKYDSEREKEAINHLLETIKVLEINRIFFYEKLCNEISNTLEECKRVIEKMRNAKDSSKYPEEFKDKNSKTPIQKWIDAEEMVKKEIKNQRFKLAQSFRDLIGVED